MTTEQLESSPATNPRPGWCLGRDGRWRPNRRDPAKLAERDALIRSLYMQGMSKRSIAPVAGCSRGTVNRVIDVARAAGTVA